MTAINLFSIKEITSNPSRELVVKVLGKWAQMVVSRLKNASLSPEIRTRLSDCQQICEQALSMIKSCSDCKQFHLYVCLDKKKIAQGIACVWIPKNENRMYISRIVTCPWNIFPKDQNQQALTAKGAGTALLTRAKSEAVKAQRDLCLNALPNAKNFYIKFGFKAENVTSNSSIPMILSYLPATQPS